MTRGTPGVRVDCTHPIARHVHGTHIAYHRDHCRCAPCVAAFRRGKKLAVYRTQTGTTSYADAALARAHVQKLLATLTVGQIEARSGVHRNSIALLLGTAPGQAPSKRMRRTSVAALLAVDGAPLGSETGGMCDPAGTRRRLQALAALGWSMRELERQCPRPGPNIRKVMDRRNDDAPMMVITRDAVRALYDRLCLTPPPETGRTARIRRWAASNGWAPPLAWDEDTIDNPAAEPQAPKGDDKQEFLDTYAELKALGLDDNQIAERIGMVRESMKARLRRLTAA